MARDITSAMQTELANQVIRPVQLLYMGFDSGDVFLTDAYKDIVYGGNTYQASGNFLGIVDITEELHPAVTTVSITVSGVNQANISLALSEDFVGRTATIYKGLLDSNEALIVDPFVIFSGTLDDFNLTENVQTANLTWTAISDWADFERIGGRRNNHTEQQIWFPGDLGFQFVDQSIKDLKWGKP